MAPGDYQEEDSVYFNVGGWFFSIPKSKLVQFGDSVLWQEASSLLHSDDARLFIDRDGYTFRHVHYYLHTSKLSFSCLSEISLLYEQATAMCLTSLQQELVTYFDKQETIQQCSKSYKISYVEIRKKMYAKLLVPLKAEVAMCFIAEEVNEGFSRGARSTNLALDNLKESKHHLRVRHEDVPVTQRAYRNYWRTRCNSKPSDFQIKSPAFTGLTDKAPLGLIDTPLLDTEEEVHWYFLPLDLVKKYPTLINEDNLLWLCEGVVLIEIGWNNFRYIANFLLTGRLILPDKPSEAEVLLNEMEMLQIPELIKAVNSYRKDRAGNSKDVSIPDNSVCHSEVGYEAGGAMASKPLYVLVLELLVKYPDSALGQLCIESSLDGMKLYIFGNGVLFKHVRSWLGTCRLPFTEDMSQMCAVCVYLDQHDSLYQPIKDAMQLYLQKRRKESLESRLQISTSNDSWIADVDSHTFLQIVKVYVGNYWYATYLNTFLKYPELLYNRNKAQWITYGKTLFIIGDGQLFRHIINFLRFDKLFIPSGFKEWPLLCQEIEDCKIPALTEALQNCEQYRIWYAENKKTVTAETVDVPVETSKSISSMDLHGRLAEKGNVLSNFIQKEYCCNNNTEIDQCRMINVNWCSKTTQTKIVSVKRAAKSHSPASSPRKAKRSKLNTFVGGKQVREDSCAPGNEVCLYDSGSPPQKRTVKPHHNGQRESVVSMDKLILFVSGPKHNDTEKAGFLSSAGSKGKQVDKSMDCNYLDGWPLDTGFIIKVHHPLLLGNDGCSEFYTDSVLYMKYSTDIADAHFGHSEKSEITGLASLIFNLSYEEIFYARECNHFLTGIILDSYTLKDPQQTTWEILHLTNFLWTEQITPETFVSKLLNLKVFKNHKQSHDKLLKWLNLTLPFARKYSHCMELLLKKGYYKSVSFPVLGN